MKKFLCIFLVGLLQVNASVAATFRLEVEVTPHGGGWLNSTGGSYEQGSKISLNTNNNTGYVFQGWFEGEDLISSSKSFSYTMPNHDVLLLAKYEFDPSVPANPAMPDTTTYYNLRASISPLGAGTLNLYEGRFAHNANVSLRVNLNTGYRFIGWQDQDGSTVSTSTSFNFVMPAHDSEIKALCEFDPSVPANPDSMATNYTVYVNSKPVGGGTFNSNSFTSAEGSNVRIYAYTNSGYKFIRWEDEKGNIIDSHQDFYYTIPHGNTTIYGVFEFDPSVPGNPNKNYWNKDLGELIIDDFTPGNLGNAASSTISGSNNNDVTMITVAGRINNNDFGIANNYSNCTLLDLSRVTGVTEVPSYAFDGTSLETVYLPATIEKIGDRAFENCKRLIALTLYAMTPPALGNNVFRGIPEGLIVYVPAASIALYQDAEGWRDFTILPIQEDIRSISVFLPEGFSAADFCGMRLELTNAKNGQRLHYVMTDRTEYTFPNIIRNTSWNIQLRNERGDVFGQINGVEVKDEDVKVTFDKLHKPQTVVLSVLTSEGKNVTDLTQIVWTDAEGNYMAQSASLRGLCADNVVTYRISLPQDLTMTYLTPQLTEYIVQEESNNIECRLESIPQVKLSGKVMDEETLNPLRNVVVSASQTFAGKYTRTISAQTDAQGNYSLTVLNVPTTLSIASSDYISQTIVCDSLLTDGNDIIMNDVALKPITGATISINFTYNPSVVEGEESDIQEWYNDYNNVTYSIFNTTKQRPITQFNVQYPRIVLLEEVDENDVLEITATSLTSSFKPVKCETKVLSDLQAIAYFDIVALGGIKASFKKTDNAEVVGTLYDSQGKLVKSYTYANAMLTISNLSDGDYTLVSMGRSSFFNNVYDLSRLLQTGLVEGKDYVQNIVEVNSGVISVVDIDQVPAFDESQFYYTDDNTSFTVNKPSIVAGNYLTLTARIDFKQDYASCISNLNLIVDLPQSCKFVENSVMVGNNTSSYALEGDRLTIPVTHYTDRIRFCVIPTLGGEYAPNAFANFVLDGVEKTQPIGNASYSVKDLEIKVPSVVAKNSIPVTGVANANSEITIYDDDIVIGSTKSLANGVYSTLCELTNPYNLSEHNIYTKVVTKEGLNLQSETKSVKYDINAIQVQNVTMYYGQYTIDFDFQNPSKEAKTYTWPVGGRTFTFTINFNQNDTTRISNVVLYVKTMKNEWIPLSTIFDQNKGLWVTSAGYEELKNSYPVNVSVDFTPTSEYLADRDEIDSNINELEMLVNDSKKERQDEIDDFYAQESVDNFYDDIISLSGEFNDETDLIMFNNSVSAKLDLILEGVEAAEDLMSIDDAQKWTNVFLFSLNEELSDSVVCLFNDLIDDTYLSDDFSIEGDQTYDLNIDGFKKVCSKQNLSSIEEKLYEEQGYNKMITTDGSIIYYSVSESSIDVIDVKNKVNYFATFSSFGELNPQSEILMYAPYKNTAYYDCGAAALKTIKEGYNAITSGESAVEKFKKIGLTLSQFLQGLNCYYEGYQSELESRLTNRYKKTIDSFKDKIAEKESLKKTLQKDLQKLNEELKAIAARVDDLNRAKEEVIKSSLSQKDKQKQLDDIQKELNELRKRNKSLVTSQIPAKTQNLKDADVAVKNLNKKIAKTENLWKNIKKEIIDRFPKKIPKGFKVPKALRISGKLSGFMGVVIQVVSLIVETQDIYEDFTKWGELMAKIGGKLDCPNDQEKANQLYANIFISSIDYLEAYTAVLAGDMSSIALSLLPTNIAGSPTWWVDQVISLVTFVGNVITTNKSEQSRKNYSKEVDALKCNKKDGPSGEGNGTGSGNEGSGGNGTGSGTGGSGGNGTVGKEGSSGKGTGSNNEDMKPYIDPSGYVYEGVFSNRLEGVTATAYYKETVEDMYGDLHDKVVKWDAAEYAQENPLFTDENGYYRWDVPQGLWQVKFEKEGYETTTSEWLPVPPPQLEVNIAMKQNIQPSVKSAHAYEDAVELEFDKYMIPHLLNAENIIVLADGLIMEGSVQLLNEEVSYEGKSETFASKIRFNASEPFAANEVMIRVSNRVKSYAGVRMQDDYMQTFAIEKELSKIVCDSAINVIYGETIVIPIAVMPAVASAGKTLKVSSSSSMILSLGENQVQIDDEGMAYITITGELPGSSMITYSVEDSKLKATTIINVVTEEMITVDSPTASIASGTVVKKGTQLSLYCKTEGASIYYTTDGSCPCEFETAIVYEEPIVINEDVTINAIAIKDGWYDSDVVQFVYTVDDNDSLEDIILEDDLRIYPLPVHDKMNISIGDKRIYGVTVVTLSGSTVISVTKPAQEVQLNMGSVVPGFYIINVTTADKTYHRKVLKVN